MADKLETEITPDGQNPGRAHDARTAIITANDHIKVWNAVTKDWHKASIIAHRTGLNSFRTKAALEFLLAGKIIERRVMPPTSKLPAWKSGGTMEVKYEYRRVPGAKFEASPGG
jgi:hypothetical protein